MTAVLAGFLFVAVGADKAGAVSADCAALNGTTGTTGGFTNQDDFLAGETITYALSPNSGSPTIDLRVNTGFPATVVRDTSTSTSDRLSFTFPSSGTWSYGLRVTPLTGSINYTVYCGVGTPSNGSMGYSDMVRSVTRSQTEVLEKNLESRIDAAFQASGTRSNAPSTGFADLAAAMRGDADDPFAPANGTSRRASLRELAMLGSFDTSRMVLSAAETDPAPGVEERGEKRLDGPFTLWGHGSYVSMENDLNTGSDDRRYDGDSWGYTLGFDYRVKPRLLTGVSLGYVDTDFTTTYNGGDYEETGWTVAPYAIYRLTERSTVSAVVGYGRGDVDRTRSGNVTGDTDSEQWFAALRGAYKSNPFDGVPLELTGRASLTIARKQVDGFTESDGTRVDKEVANMRRFKPGVEAAYGFATGGGVTVQPFLKADYVHDFTDAVNGDQQAYNLGAGLRLNGGTTGLSGSISTERQFGRSKYDEYGIEGLIAYNFGLKREGGAKASLAPYVKSDFDATTGQRFGTGLRFSDLDGAATVDLGLTHELYAFESDDDETVTGRATVGRLRVELQF